MPRQCRRRGCQQEFYPRFKGQLYCYRCRSLLLELQAYARAKSMNVEALQAAAIFSKFRDLWDWKIVDENGKVVWASDLANRYRNQTKPRGMMRS